MVLLLKHFVEIQKLYLELILEILKNHIKNEYILLLLENVFIFEMWLSHFFGMGVSMA